MSAPIPLAARRGEKLTVKNRTPEVSEELDEHVRLLGRKLVPSRLLASGLDISGGQTAADVGLNPFFGADKGVLLLGSRNTVARAGREEALVPGLALGALVTTGDGAAARAGGRDVAVQGRVLIETRDVVHVGGVAMMVTILHVGSVGDPPLRHCCFGSQGLRNPEVESRCTGRQNGRVGNPEEGKQAGGGRRVFNVLNAESS